MAEAIASDLAVKLLESLGKLAAQKLAPYFGGQGKLNELQLTMEMIQARLHDAERRREGKNGSLVKLWLKRLKRVLYKLDDLFEDVSVVNKEREHIVHEGRFSNLARYGKNKFDRLKLNEKVSREFEDIMKELEAIKSVMGGLNLREYSIEEQRALNFVNKRETHSFIMEEEVIGRKNDKDKIMEMLFNSDHGETSVSTIPIVGIGGLGKTTLAQLVFNEENVIRHFDTKVWACISETSSWQELAGKILKSVASIDYQGLSIDEIQYRLREAFNGKRYLLVLDDVWDEDRERWAQVWRLLCGGKQGSKILVTTRSPIVAEIMGGVEPYLLGGLSKDESWALFASLAFRVRVEETNQHLMSIGRDIVKKCANVPLAIRTIAGLLYSKQTEQEWENFRDKELCEIQQNGNGPNDIMSTLKLSYDHLSSQLKHCFAYCSLFPKDHIFDKQRLIWLWMAQGYIRPVGNESLEAAGDEYFMELLRRGFFQDVIRNEHGRIMKCKMHDLMHDLACEVGDECLFIDGSIEKINDETRHVSLFIKDCSGSSSLLLSAKRMRSLFCRDMYTKLDYLNTITSRWKYLRAIELCGPMDWKIGDSIGELKHLRYLKLESMSIWLPDGITRLHNLQTFDLCDTVVEEWPRGFSKMNNLRHLRLGLNIISTSMPPSFGQLTSLQTLDRFVVGEDNGLDSLASLDLSGALSIYFRRPREEAKAEAKKANLKGKKLTSLTLDWFLPSWLRNEVLADEVEVLESLEPPPTLEELRICDWNVVKLHGWRRMDESTFPNLVSIDIERCERCVYLPPLSRLPRLRYLRLAGLSALEYVEHGGINRSEASPSTYFPSLKHMQLQSLQELKGWSRVGDDGVYLKLPLLSKLEINDCPKLMYMPLVPRIRELEVNQVPNKLLEQLFMNKDEPTSSTSSSSSTNNPLEHLLIGRSPKLTVLPESIGNLTHLRELHISECYELRSFPESFRNLTALQTLRISYCNMKSFPESFRDLTALQSLCIKVCPNLEWHDKEWPVKQDIN